MKRGFTLIEALVSVILLGVGVVASLQALGTLNKTESRVFESQRAQKLAHQKLDELISTEQIQYAPIDGNFEDEGVPNLEWSLETEPSEVESLLIVRLHAYAAGEEPSEGFTVTTLIYDVSQTSGAAAP